MKRFKIEDLNRIYEESETLDQEIFAEMRSSMLLVSGDHYNRRNSKYWNRIRDAKDVSAEQKIRLTKNHIQKITKTYINNIVSYAPSVMIVPKNDKELQDQKSASMNQAVWQDLRQRCKLRQRTIELAQDFVELGECAVKVFWDVNAGDFMGWEPETDDEGQVMYDDDGKPLPSKRPVFTGDLVFEKIYPFNLLRHPDSKDMLESKCLIVRKMMDRRELRAKVGNDPEKQRMIESDSDKSSVVFDGSRNGYVRTENQALLLEYYFRPCYEYPNGYYYIATKLGILWEGELPFGIYPISYAGFDSSQISPRHHSIVKQLRPYQVEVNRSASKVAEHQITLGDDKLLIQAGTKLSHGGQLPGVRGVQYTGMKPEVLEGRSGAQYLEYMNSQISEMYSVANMQEDMEEKQGQSDPFGLLFSSMRYKKKFSLYAEKFEHFLIEMCRIALELAKEYYDEERLVPAVGRHEYINIAEFKSTDKLAYQIKLEPQVDDLETTMGRQLVLNHTLQYVGGQLDKEDLGKIIRTMPFGNLDESFSDLTLDYDSAVNIILALDRGEQPMPSPYDNHAYFIKRLVSRMRQSDFKLLNPQVQQNYQMLLQQYEKMQAQQQQEIQAAQSGFIPSGGAMVKVDYYVPKMNDPTKSERALLPAESVDWLLKRLAQQGSSQETLQSMNMGVQTDIARQVSQAGAGQPPMPVNQIGQASPIM